MIKRVTLKGQAYDYLKEAIVKGELPPGEIYSEQYFADKLEISRTPIREAILQLSQEGFVEIYPNRGMLVKKLSPQEVEELFQLRSAIECYCCKYAAERVDSPEGAVLLHNLETHLAQEEAIVASRGTPAACMTHDAKFHQTLIDFMHNQQLAEVMRRLRSRINLVGVTTLYKPGRMEVTLDEHREIVDNIRQGRPLEAYTAAEHHFHMAREIILSSPLFS